MELRVWPQKHNNFFDNFGNTNEIGYYPEASEDRNGLFENIVDTHESYVPPDLDIQSSYETCYSPLQCTDFEERGFCLLGDICPMQHGAHKIVVDDVQSLYQYNLQLKPPSSQSSDYAEVASPPSSGIYSFTGGDGSTDSYDPDHPLLTDPDHPLLTDPDHPLLTDPDHPLLTDPDHSLFTDPDHSLFTDPDHPLLMDPSLQIPSPTYPILPASPVRATSSSQTYPIISVSPVRATPSSHTYSRTRPVMAPTDSKRKTVYVGRIPKKDNIREALLSHFSRFGHISGIHIPSGRDEAFVRFSKREEAQAALRAPDALLGNRFVILRWAKRDCFPDIDALSLPKPQYLKSVNNFENSNFISPVSRIEKGTGGVEVRKKQKETPLDENQMSLRINAKSFSIIPPLPPGFSEVAVLKKHFSRFGEVSRVEIHDVRESPTTFVTRVTFTTRSAAELAFMCGALWNGHTLRFMWPNTPFG